MAGDSPPQPLSKTVSFASAGLGGIAGWICVHPANTLAIRMNLANMSGTPPGGFGQFATKVVKEEGFMTLYKGLSAGITRQIFYATSRFGLYEVIRDKVAEVRPIDIWARLAVGCISGGMAAAISCPAEVSLVRMSNDMALPIAERRNYKSVFDAGVRIARDEGVRAFWRGSMPFVNRAMLVGACQVATYDQFKETYKKLGVPDGFPNLFASAMSSGLLYSVVTMPFETTKNRMAFQQPGADGKLLYRTTIQSIGTIAKTEGVLALWNGFLPYYARCGGHTITMFLAIEQLRKYYRRYCM